jgi:hypothetical protein
MTEIKYNFSNHVFPISNKNIKTQGTLQGTLKYFELTYPVANDSTPIFKYDKTNYYPLKLIITKLLDASFNMVIETIGRKDGENQNKLYVSVILANDNTSPKQPLTTLFAAISANTNTVANIDIQLNSLFDGLPSTPSNKLRKSNTSPDLTLHITPAITTKLGVDTILGNAVMADICKTLTSADGGSEVGTNLKVSLSELIQRQKCTRSTDNASPSTQVVAKPKPSNIQTSILALVIIGLCIAAFFQDIYSIVVCLPVGSQGNNGAIHMIYAIGMVCIAIPLMVRGFKDGDLDAQVWGIGLIFLILIFFWKFNMLASEMKLNCSAGPVLDKKMVVQLKELFGEGKIIKTTLYIMIHLSFLITASVKSTEVALFNGMLGGQAAVTVLFVLLFNGI